MQSNEVAIWRLRPGLERKFTKGHPWVFSNDLDQSPSGLEPGAWVELRDSRDGFLAFGYGNPSTLIAFRVLSRNPVKTTKSNKGDYQVSFEALVELMKSKLDRAAKIRHLTGVDRYSHRLIFGEADELPGVIIDRYRTPARQVFVIQCSTAGSDHLIEALLEALPRFSRRVEAFEGADLPSAYVIAQDSSARSMEGLRKEPRRAVGADVDELRKATIEVQCGESANSATPVLYDVDFIEGQKTGFFLDQRANVRLAWPLIERAAAAAKLAGRELRVLDLFSYVGQWSVQVARAAQQQGAKANVTLADASLGALEIAQWNVTRAGGKAETKKMDILADIGSLPVGGYDIVICDPPAFIKKKKDHPTGLAAYQKLNREAMKRVAPGGVFVSCSCSGLLTEEEFLDMLTDARRAAERDLTWVSHGGHGEDHPFRTEFSQGRYLKGWIGVMT